MPSSRKFISLLLVFIAGLSVTVIIASYFLLPSFIEKRVTESVLQNTALTSFNLTVEKAGPFGLHITDIDAGDADSTILSISSIVLKYTPLSLIAKRIKGIVIYDLTVFLEFTDGRISIPVLEDRTKTGKQEQQPTEIILPADFSELQIKESLLQIRVESEQLSIPFQLSARQNNRTSLTSLLQLYPGPEQVSLETDIDLARNGGNLTFFSHNLPLERFAPFIWEIPGLELTGRAILDGTSEIRLQPLGAVSASIAIALQPFTFSYNAIKVQSAAGIEKDLPIRLEVDYTDGMISYRADNIALTEPVAAVLATDGSAELSEKHITGAGNLQLTVQQLPSLKIKDRLHLFADVSYGYSTADGRWNLGLTKSPSPPMEMVRVMFQAANIKINEPGYAISAKGVDGSGDLSFSALLPTLSITRNDLLGTGTLELAGDLHFDTDGLRGEMQADFRDGRLELTENNYVISDIAMSAHLPVLPRVRTAAGQELRFSRAAFGEFAITDGMMHWQLESDDTLIIEDSVFKWANGRIRVDDVRLTLGKDEQFIKVACERLDLIEVLRQFGMKNPEGTGTISGNVPVYIGKRTIKFENGILSSSQGEGGKIKIGALELLSAGIPKNTPQFAQVDFAAEALKNFNYDWVKLFLNSEGEDLVMQLQMYGKPVQSLPFKYDSTTGLLMRDDKVKQGIYQPIRLDVNFRFPLNRLLGYSGRIQDILDKIK
ncbi:MAG: hypothetical protein AMK70_15120 [Nitrospira bacterium SG8_35_1]|nr:MAG: hypothetical protein AMK70_15120 [Nitrospira bacterium SG8_35_1]